MSLSTRETATLVWIGVFLVWAFRDPKMRPALSRVVTTALHWKLLLPTLAIITYSSCVVWILFQVGFWHSYLLKDTVVWVIVSGIALGLSGVSFKEDTTDWRRVVVEQLKAVVLVEYLVNTYTFSIWMELAMLPFMTIVVVLTSFASTDEKHEIAAIFGQFIQTVVGLVVLWFAFKGALEQAGTFSMAVAMREVLLPIVLSAALIPVSYVLALISAYEQLFLVLEFGENKAASLIRYAKWRIFLRLGFSKSAVRALLKDHRHDLLWAQTRADIDRALQSVPNHRSTGS